MQRGGKMEHTIYPNFKKTFMELMREPKLQLPKRGGKEYYQSLEELYDFYCSHLTDLTDKQISAIKNLCNQILKIVSLSNQDKAYQEFEELMIRYTKYHAIHIIKDVLPIDGYGVKNTNLFRVRKEKANYEFTRDNIFHQPINQYRYINAYRYNLTASPSLYLSATVQCCLKELNTKVDKGLIGSMFRLHPCSIGKLYVIDFGVRPIDFVKSKRHYVEGYKYQDYLFTYPLLAACSFVVSDKSAPTKPEYAITNLLLRWLVNHHSDSLCGIRYFSCHNAVYIMDDGKGPKKEDTIRSFTKRFINYVFPIEDDAKKEGDFSKKLNQYFLVNKPKLSYDCIDIRDFEGNIKKDTQSLKRVVAIKELAETKK